MQQAQLRTYSIDTSVSRVLRNTYMLLSITVAISAITAYFSVITQAPPVNFFILLIAMLGLPMLVHATANSSLGLVTISIFSAFMGYVLGPILSYYLSIRGGGEIIASAFSLTAFAFLGLSGYVLISGKSFSRITGFLVMGSIILLGAILLNMFMQIPALSLAISVALILLACGYILAQTSMILEGIETNYIRAAVTLYISIFQIFVNLLQLLGLARGSE